MTVVLHVEEEVKREIKNKNTPPYRYVDRNSDTAEHNSQASGLASHKFWYIV